jgi:hypothetical protein
LVMVLPLGLRAQTAGASNACAVLGARSLQAGTVATYSLRGCQASDWQVSCGVINAKTDSSVTIFLNSASSSSLVITALSGGSPIATKNVTIKLAQALNGGSIDSGNQAIGWRSAPATITASAAAQGLCNGMYAYQWFRSTDSVHFDSIPGATGRHYQSGPLDSSAYFKRQTSCGGSVIFTSNTVRVLVRSKIMAQSITPEVQLLDADSLPIAMTVLGVSGGNNAYTYQWQSAKAGGPRIWQPIAGATSASYLPGEQDTSTYYRVLIRSGSDSGYSPEAVIDVHPPLVGGAIYPATQTISNGGVPLFLNLEGFGGGKGGYAYQWNSSPDGVNWNPLQGVTTTGFGPPGNVATAYYRVAVSSGGVTVTSVPAEVIVSSGNSNQ